MALSFLSLMTRRLVVVLLEAREASTPRDVEIAVVWQQLDLLCRQVKQPEFRIADRPLLAALSTALPRWR